MSAAPDHPDHFEELSSDLLEAATMSPLTIHVDYVELLRLLGGYRSAHSEALRRIADLKDLLS